MNELQPLIDVGEKLRTVFEATIDSCPGLSRRPIEMAKALKVDKMMTSRLCSALRSDDSVALLGMLPGALPLKQFLHAVGSSGGDSKTIDLAHAILDEFEALVKAEFDDRTGLNAVVSAVVPGMAKRHELKVKQDAFRAFETFRGISADACATSFFYCPNVQDHDQVDSMAITAIYGLRRIHPGGVLEITNPTKIPNDRIGRALGVDKHMPVFREFCRPSNIEIVRTDLPGEARYQVAGSAFGRSSAVDLVVANGVSVPRQVNPPANTRSITHTLINDPFKYLVMDVLVHESLWTGTYYFELHVYDALNRIGRSFTPSNMDLNQWHLNESLESLGRGIKRLRCPKIPRYFEMIETTMQRMGWDPETFRCYRCQIDYPVYGSQVCFIQTPLPPEVETKTQT